jgi:Rod binding domain-containing protein
MDLAPRPPALQLPRVRADWPLATVRPGATTDDADVARQFETIIAETLLRSARAASLGDDGFGTSDLPGADNIRAMVDHARAEAIARAAPMGVARLLAAEAQPRKAQR